MGNNNKITIEHERPISQGRVLDDIDLEVGRRVRAVRMMKEISQQALARELGITFQQIQKYEKGISRISASKLKKIAAALDTPIRYFFQLDEEASSDGEGHARLLPVRDAVLLMRAFSRIADRGLRKIIVALVEKLATNGETQRS